LEDVPVKLKVAIPILCLLAALTFLPSAHAALRPLVGWMLEQLASVNLIGRGLAVNNLDQVARGADAIIERGEEMGKSKSDALGIPEGQRGAFNAYVDELLLRARDLRAQARKGETDKAAVAYRKLVERGCVPCHQVFRDQKGKLPRVVHLMTTLNNSFEEIDRGIILKDYRLIGIRAREVQHVARLMEWDQIIEVAFKVKEADRQSFKAYAGKLDKAALAVEEAAEQEDEKGVLSGVSTMLTQSCLPCHRAFREGGG
jgi:cytochrome c556